MQFLSSHYIAQNPVWRYVDFEKRVWQIVHQFRQHKISTVALWFEDGAKLACTLLACWHANVRAIFLPNLAEENLVWGKSLVDLWLTDTQFPLDDAVQFDCFATEYIEKIIPDKSLMDFISETEFLLKTSGSTGSPKIITKTAGQLWQNAQACAKTFGFTSDNSYTAISTVSIQHLYGLICQIMMPLVLGWQIERKQQFFPEMVSSACKQAEKSVLITSPTMLCSIDWHRLKFPNLTAIVSAGGRLSEDVGENIFTTTNVDVIDFYGTTEIGAIATKQRNQHWKPMENVMIGVDDRSALWVEAPWAKGREQTEDVVCFHSTYFEMLGRADRILKLGDKRISLLSVESALLQHHWVEDIFVGKHPDFDRLVAWVALSESGMSVYHQSRKVLVTTLKQHLAHTQDKMAFPRFWRFTNKLPRNAQSKLSKIDFENLCRSKKLDEFYV
ncbi:TPA: AMP-binding protein [Haemophilus influenzae]|uniref:AMP-binding protein n=1 Tax=Haemophilus influenzae TaxID=727 RepID=UPI000D00953D|nr:class I adenylate-forming enzyme family protein [Haemophilus influenzae]PRJ57698.1 2-succinylbenzoate--CoA ligase [Haemophilus influenzae]PRJ58714.1 2-succinylbenzoate--CoA ligase [Haemophilus influenzae]